MARHAYGVRGGEIGMGSALIGKITMVVVRLTQRDRMWISNINSREIRSHFSTSEAEASKYLKK